jgi:excisionase family DNA binding protein
MEKLLSTEEAAGFLNCQPQTLNRWRHEGKGPRYFKVGRLVRYSENQLKEWIGEHVFANTVYTDM